ncbi:MOP flippase family protein [Aeromonas caviae]|uniref:MOP flippase family protein n=1 Tax=Aeromonas caviae TaxID=648 RepID=UPI000DD960D0|nr:MOP flippase family protein [Aeromonas caviae]AXB01972.1 MOP flippase family protein [Aeromonas caviae]MBL0538007.1 MOP flippase family protein [Aeromonas caviae]
MNNKPMSLSSNLKWVALSKVIQIALQLISLTVLTHLLAPSEYGLMAMATVVTNFTLIVRDLGTAAAIIQRKELDQTIKSTVFWLNMIMGTIIALIVVLGSPFIAHLFNETALVPVLLWLALSFPIASLGTAQQALLERESHFRKLASIEICASAMALTIALGMAYQGFGVYSLVGQTLATCTISTLLLWRSAHWRPSWIFAKSHLRQLLGFSGNLTAFNLINYFSRNADAMIIGYYFTAAVLGAYSLAYRVMLFPLQSLTSVVSRSLYPLMSRKQDDPAHIKAMYLKVLTFIASMTAPMMAGLVVLREPFVAITFGAQWTLVPSILLWLAPTGFVQSLISTTGSVFMAHGKTQLLMKLGILSAILQVGAFVIGGQYDVQTLALLYLVANLVNALPAMYFTMQTVHGSLLEVAQRLVAPLLGSAIMVAALLAATHYSATLISGQHPAMFAGHIVLGILVYVASYRLLFAKQLAQVLPAKFSKLLWL